MLTGGLLLSNGVGANQRTRFPRIRGFADNHVSRARVAIATASGCPVELLSHPRANPDHTMQDARWLPLAIGPAGPPCPARLVQPRTGRRGENVMTDITALLRDAQEGERPDLGPVFECLYGELKRIAQSRLAGHAPGQTLGSTALVHEAYLKLAACESLSLQSSKHFFACAARAMRQILIDRARVAGADKRGAGLQQVTLGNAVVVASDEEMLELDEALRDLARIDPVLSELVELRYFAGLSLPRIAELRGISTRTAARDWERARALLRVRLAPDVG
jgi:RNA polymerase sigma factor (TIGR02999 family)